MEKLIQVRVEERIKTRCDAIFETDGMTTQQAIKTFLYQVAKSGKSPYDNVFYGGLSAYEPLQLVADEKAKYIVKGRDEDE